MIIAVISGTSVLMPSGPGRCSICTMRSPPTLLLRILLTSPLLLFKVTACLAANLPDPLPGLWEQVDEKTGKVQALVRIVERPGGRYQGFVEKLFIAPGEDPNPRCEDCTDERKNQPVLGMRIISDLKRSGTDSFGEGEILDPDSGDTYRLKITIMDGGKKLDVRGFIGISLFGRSQIWLKASSQGK